ncbi:hypothetical protein [Duodenibacillus massiliensis]|uniref:hypothetical protein n=2 Tax=Duodenibacillus massiliensis TaxID=1852381 RepID=UPI00307C4254
MNVTKMTFRFYDRTKEPADLRAFSRQVEDDASRMIIISSRRRIGRTTLANPAFTNGPLPCLFSISAMKKPPKPTLRLFGGFMLRHWAWNIFRPPCRNHCRDDRITAQTKCQNTMTVVLDEFQNAKTVEPALVTDFAVL